MTGHVRCTAFDICTLVDLKCWSGESKPSCTVLSQEGYVSGWDSENTGLVGEAQGQGQGQTGLLPTQVWWWEGGLLS